MEYVGGLLTSHRQYGINMIIVSRTELKTESVGLFLAGRRLKWNTYVYCYQDGV